MQTAVGLVTKCRTHSSVSMAVVSNLILVMAFIACPLFPSVKLMAMISHRLTFLYVNTSAEERRAAILMTDQDVEARGNGRN